MGEEKDILTQKEEKADSAAGEGKTAGAAEKLSIEDAFAKIRELLAEMDRDDVTLEKSFENYEKGMKLIRYCNDKIDRVEKKVQKLNADGSVSDFAE